MAFFFAGGRPVPRIHRRRPSTFSGPSKKWQGIAKPGRAPAIARGKLMGKTVPELFRRQQEWPSMRILPMPPQIVRLVVLTIAIVGSYLTARMFLTPESFGQYGWYRGEALNELSAREPVFAGRKSCEECHSDVVRKLAKAEHKGLSCEGCHGVSLAHTQNPDNALLNPPKMAMSACTRCHEASPSRPKWLRQVASAHHYAGQKCTECHLPHQPQEVPP
jgi:hypothetical protein